MNRFAVGVVVILAVALGVFLFVSQQSPPPSEAPPESGEADPAAPGGEGPSSAPDAPEDPGADPGTTAAPLRVTAVTLFPPNGMVALGGELRLQATVANAGDEALTQEVAVVAGGAGLGEPQAVALDPGASRTLTFVLDDLGALGEGAHTLSVAGREIALTVVAPATSSDRPGQLPPDPKVLGAGYGLHETGLPGGKIALAQLSGPKTLNGIVAQETSSTDVTNLLQWGLVEENPATFEIEPALAAHWEFSEDQRTITFYLRRGVKFSDGEPFTAEDVAFTFNDLLFNDDVITDARDPLTVAGEPVRVEMVDEYTVTVTAKEPFRPLLRAMAVDARIYPEHKLADKVAKLNPGARGALRGVRGAVDNHREALAELAPELVGAVDAALEGLADAIEAQDAAAAEAAAGTASVEVTDLITILDAEDEAQAEVEAALSAVLPDLEAVGGYAAQGKWEGVPRGTFNQTWTVNTPADEIVGLGPYRFVRYDVDQQVILERNPHYWKVDANGVQLPYADQLALLVAENQDVAYLKFNTGEIDTYAPRPEDWPLLMEGVPQDDCAQRGDKLVCLNQAKGWELLRGGPLFGTLFLVLNQDIDDPVLRAVYRNLDFRRALAHAIDKGSIIDNIYNGLAVSQWSPVSVPSPFYDDTESFATYAFDLERARALLDGLGLTDSDGDGVRNVRDAFLEAADVALEGLPAEADRELEFLLSTNSGNTIREKTSTLIASDLGRLGIRVNFRPLDFNSLVTDLLGSKYEAVVIGLTGGVEPNSGANIWKTEGGLHFWRFSAAQNPPEWEKRVDELFELAATTFDTEAVQEYYREYQRLVSEHLPLIYTVNQQYIYASKAALANTQGFQAITNNTPTVLAFAEVLWWTDDARRAQVEAVEPQG